MAINQKHLSRGLNLIWVGTRVLAASVAVAEGGGML